MTKYIAIVSLLASVVLAAHPALNPRNLAPQNQAASAHAAHLRLLGRGAHGLIARQDGCPSGTVPCGSAYCMPEGNICCVDDGGDGSISCDPGQWCVNQGGSCCSPGDVACGAGCMPPGSVCCDESAEYCLAGQVCVGGGECCSGSDCVAQASLPAGPVVTSPGSAPTVLSTPIESTTSAAATTPAVSTPVATIAPVTTTPETTFAAPTTTTAPVATTPETTFAAPTAVVSSSSSSAEAGPVIATMGGELMAVMVAAMALL